MRHATPPLRTVTPGTVTPGSVTPGAVKSGAVKSGAVKSGTEKSGGASAPAPRRRRGAATFLVGCLFAIGALPAQAAPPRPLPETPREGERSAPGRWYVDGGNVARSAASANGPLVRRPLVAWRVPIEGTIVGEPLVWDDHVVLGIKVSDKRSRIEVRRLDDGAAIGHRELDSTSAPWPSLWGNEVVWRVGDGGLELLRFDDRKVSFVARTPTLARVGPPLRFGSRVYVVVDGRLTCLRAADFRELWQSELGGYRGPVSMAGDELYAWRAVGDGSFAIVAHDRKTGARNAQGPALPLERAPDEDARIAVAGRILLARLGDRHALRGFAADVPINAFEFRLPLQEQADLLPVSMPVPRALDTLVQVGAVGVPGGKQLGLFPFDREAGIRLDACELHRALADAPPTLVRGVVYFGACAVDVDEYRMLWRVPGDADRPLPATRAVPAGRSLLLAGAGELVALREDAPADPVAAELHAAWQAGQRDRLMTLVDGAVRANDWDLATDLLGECRERRVEEAWATKREKDIARRRKDKRKRPDAAAAERVRAEADGAVDAALDEVYGLLADWDAARSPADRRRGLRFVLEHAPAHAAAQAAVRALLPADVEPAEPFLAEDWLDFLDAASRTRVEWLDASLDESAGPIDPIVAQSKQQLALWRSQWRPDLQALSSDRLVLFAPLIQPGSLAKALATGELVCDALESMFAHMPVVRHDPRQLLVFIYPDREEYVAESAKLGIDASWTAGYYSDRLNELVAKSRLFVPSDDVGFAGVLPTLAHELTHHWLMDRCPAFTPHPVAARVGPKSFWIVEGFASLVEQFEFDVVNRRFALGNGNPEYPDLVASAPERLLIPWDRLVGMRRLDYDRLIVSERQVDVPSSVRLGQAFTVRAINMFYAQSAMLARYLYDAEDGRHRQQLFDFVVAYYTGASERLDFDRAFGRSAKELGPEVVAYCRQRIQ